MEKKSNRRSYSAKRWTAACVAAVACLVFAVALVAPVLTQGPSAVAGMGGSLLSSLVEDVAGTQTLSFAAGIHDEPVQAEDADPDAAGPVADGAAEAEGVRPAAEVGTTVDDGENLVVTTPAGEVSIPKDAVVDYGEANYEPDVVLVRPAEGWTGADIVTGLEEAGAPGATVVEQADGYVEITLPEGLDVEQATALLRTQETVEAAQPNFVYTLNDQEPVSLSTQVDASGLSDGAVSNASRETSSSNAASDTATASDEATPEPSSPSDDEDASKSGPSSVDGDDSASVEETDPNPAPASGLGSASAGAEADIEPASPSETEGSSATEDEEPQVEEPQPTTREEPSEDAAADAEDADEEELKTQAAVNDTYVKSGSVWYLSSIHAQEAWELQKTEKAVTVAVIDEGFNINHEDLAGNIVAPYNVVTKQSTAAALAEESGQGGHGTHVLGLVGAIANNGKGIAGVSYNARIMPIKVFNKGKSATSRQLADGIAYALKNKDAYNVRVINISLGMPTADMNWADDELIKKIDEAYKAGVVVVCSGGNADGKDGQGYYAKGSDGKSYRFPYYNYPADYDKVVGVISLAQNGGGVTRSPSSNYNKTENGSVILGKGISAPGTNIYSTWWNGASSNSTYGALDGTSMAAPQVAGVFALLFSSSPDLTAQEAIERVYNTATDLGAAGIDAYYGYGEVNAYKALRENGFLKGDASILKGSSLTLTATIPSGGNSVGWTWKSSNGNVASVSANGPSATVTGKAPGTATITATSADGKYKLAKYVTVYSASISGSNSIACGASSTFKVTSSPAANWNWSSSNASVAAVASNGLVTGKKVGTATITATLASNDKVKLTKSVSVTQANLSSASISAIGNQTYTGKAITPSPTVKHGNATLKNGTDYSLSYKNNVNVGTATVIVTGKGNYTGSKSVNFNIVRPAAKAWSAAGATSMPVSSTCVWGLSNCSLRVKSGGAYVTVSGSIVTAKAAGTAVLSIIGSNGSEVSTRTVKVYGLSGTYYVQSAMNANMVLDISGCSTDNGGNMIIWPKNGGANQKFGLERQSDGSYFIRSGKSGKLVDVSGLSRADGGNVLQWAPNGGANQRWRVTVDASNRLSFVNVNSGKLLDVDGARAVNGRNVLQWRSNGGINQKWTLAASPTGIGAVYEGTYRIAPAANTGFSLDVNGAAAKRGSNVTIWRSNGGANQKFRLVHVRNGLYRIECIKTGVVLDVSGGAWRPGANVIAWSWKGGAPDNQLWRPVRNADGTWGLYRNGNLSWTLDVSGNRMANGANVQLWRANGSQAQKFRLYQY